MSTSRGNPPSLRKRAKELETENLQLRALCQRLKRALLEGRFLFEAIKQEIQKFDADNVGQLAPFLDGHNATLESMMFFEKAYNSAMQECSAIRIFN